MPLRLIVCLIFFPYFSVAPLHGKLMPPREIIDTPLINVITHLYTRCLTESLHIPGTFSPPVVNPVVCCPMCVAPPPFPAFLPSFPTPLLPASVSTSLAGNDSLRSLPPVRQPLFLTRFTPVAGPRPVPVTATMSRPLQSALDQDASRITYPGTRVFATS